MIGLRVNGTAVTLPEGLDPNMPLLWVLREHLGLTGSKFGCGQGFCGACTVHVDGQAMRRGKTRWNSGAALKPALSIEDGRVVQSNFHDLPVLRMDETPDIQVIVVDSNEKPTGIGKIAVPPLAPALANSK